MNKQKLEELQEGVISALEFALADINAISVDDRRSYDNLINCINNVEEARETLENIQIELDKETEEGQK